GCRVAARSVVDAGSAPVTDADTATIAASVTVTASATITVSATITASGRGTGTNTNTVTNAATPTARRSGPTSAASTPASPGVETRLPPPDLRRTHITPLEPTCS